MGLKSEAPVRSSPRNKSSHHPPISDKALAHKKLSNPTSTRKQIYALNNLEERQQEDLILASIPFRFKAGGDGRGSMPSTVTAHSHRSTTKSSNKAFKSRKATKGALKELAKGMNLNLF
jgi:pre-rRNA-processing protein TSR1